MIPYLGIQNDEALFASTIYPPFGAEYSLQIGRHQIPLMLMSYLGTLKGGLYAPIFRVWPPGAYSTRVPMILVGAVTIWLFYLFLDRLAGRAVAAAGCFLLASDPVYLLTGVFDWGPVALQHLFLLGGCLLLLGFHQKPQWQRLAGGFFLFGLGMWDKALFIWLLVGLGAGALAAFPRELARLLTPARLAIAAASFCLGALPLLIYNAVHPLATLQQNTSYAGEAVGAKAVFLAHSLQGGGFFGWAIREDEEGKQPRQPQAAVERASLWLSHATDQPRRTLLLPALLAALLVWPLWRAGAHGAAGGIRFAVVAMAVAWLQMALTRGAGASLHHTALLWPLPQMILALALGWGFASRKWIARAALAALLAANLLVLNHSFAQMVRNGSSAGWSDAIYSLARYIRTVPASWVVATDWGIIDNLRLLNAGTSPLANGTDHLNKPSLDETDKARVRILLALPGCVFVRHTDGNEVFAGVDANLSAVAREFRFRKEVLRVISDRLGRPIFEVFRFHSSADLKNPERKT